MAIKIKKALHEELLKIKRQKKSVSTYLTNAGYSVKYITDVVKNWNDIEVIGGPVSVNTKTKVKVVKPKATVKKVTKPKATKKVTTKKITTPDIVLRPTEVLHAPKIVTPPPLPLRVQTVVDTTPIPVEKELVLNISEGLEVKAEVQVKQLTHPKFFMASLVKILQSKGAKVTFNAGLNLNNANETLDGFTLAINEVH